MQLLLCLIFFQIPDINIYKVIQLYDTPYLTIVYQLGNILPLLCRNVSRNQKYFSNTFVTFKLCLKKF